MAIKELVFGIPSEPQVYFIRDDSPRLQWKCRCYGVSGQSILLRCQYSRRHFSIIKNAARLGVDEPKRGH
jgi:hypothetical protein